MARKPQIKGGSSITIDLGSVNSKPQEEFFLATEKYLCYGGARGGGKTWAARVRALKTAIENPGIRIWFIRRHYGDLDDSVIAPILAVLPEGVGAYTYNAQKHLLTLWNGSTIKFRNMEGYSEAVNGGLQGQEADNIFVEEATQFTEAEFRGICACLRGANSFNKQAILTCNPGGVGHQWVKRLFVTRDFRDDENPDDYRFIKATVFDNIDLLKGSPDYVAQLKALPEDIRDAHLNGNWDALMGGYFPEFTWKTHVVKDFDIPPEWAKYRAFDYGLDMFFCIWVACDFDGHYYVYREYAESRLNVPEAARACLAVTPASERIEYTIAPSDIWSTQKTDGKTMAQSFMSHGIPLVKGDRTRVQGWLALKEMLMLQKDKETGEMRPTLSVFASCKGLIDDLMAIQHDDKNPSDCAVQPHEITHGPDALRYFAIMRTMPPKIERPVFVEDYGGRQMESYEDYMCGGAVDDSYLWHGC